MNIQVRFKGFPTSDGLAEHITRKIHQHLARFGHRVTSVDARLSDINGPRGGRDKRCLLLVHVTGAPLIQVEELHDDFYTGVDHALARVAQTVGRTIARAREHHAASVQGRVS
jgi:putative sigma-54 modulation protein